MADKSDSQPNSDTEKLDLSGLSSLSLGPDWVSGKPSRTTLPKGLEDKGQREGGRGPKGPRKDRRGGPPARRRPEGERRERPHREERAEPFSPVVEADFYPEEEPFRVMTQAIRNSCRTFELFEIARLILEKPDRFVCVVRDPLQKEGETPLLYASVPDGLPFRSEEAALSHTMRHYLGEFFEMETVEVEPPAGSFQLVHKCGITGEVLCPPNYHRYQAICREHHATKLSHLPFERFEQKLESSRDEEDISAWMEKMKTQTRYTSKEDSSQVFTSLEDARLHLLTQAREKLVRPAYSARFSGKSLALLNPADPIRRSVEFRLEGQRRFPLDTANHLRGRLRRVSFAVYKRGTKGVSFVCAVKRRFRKPGEVMADNLSDLIGFLEAHPNFAAKDLPKTYLGIRPVMTRPDDKAHTTAQEVASEMGSPEAAEVAKEPVAQISPEDQARIRQLKNDLHYLVSEGYVTEYSDGRLYVPPVREEGTGKAKAEESGKQPEPGPVVTEEPTQPSADPEPVAEVESDAEPVAEETSEEILEPEAEQQSAAEIEPKADLKSAPVAEPVQETEAAGEPVAESVEDAGESAVEEIQPEAVAPKEAAGTETAESSVEESSKAEVASDIAESASEADEESDADPKPSTD